MQTLAEPFAIQTPQRAPFLQAMRDYRSQVWQAYDYEDAKELICRSCEAESIYRTVLTQLNAKAAEAMRAKGLNQFADALEADDFSQLAV